jgi:hypothetical protein
MWSHLYCWANTKFWRLHLPQKSLFWKWSRYIGNLASFDLDHPSGSTQLNQDHVYSYTGLLLPTVYEPCPQALMQHCHCLQHKPMQHCSSSSSSHTFYFLLALGWRVKTTSNIYCNFPPELLPCQVLLAAELQSLVKERMPHSGMMQVFPSFVDMWENYVDQVAKSGASGGSGGGLAHLSETGTVWLALKSGDWLIDLVA